MKIPFIHNTSCGKKLYRMRQIICFDNIGNIGKFIPNIKLWSGQYWKNIKRYQQCPASKVPRLVFMCIIYLCFMCGWTPILFCLCVYESCIILFNFSIVHMIFDSKLLKCALNEAKNNLCFHGKLLCSVIYFRFFMSHCFNLSLLHQRLRF